MTSPINPPFDDRWDYDHPAETERRFQELLPDIAAMGDLDALLQLYTQLARAQALQHRFADANATLDSVRDQLTEFTPLARVRYLLERGRCLRSDGQRDAACTWFHDAYVAAQHLHHDPYSVDALHMLGIADVPARSMQWNQAALALAEASADPRARQWRGSLLNNLGWTAFDADDYPLAMAYFQQALQCREEQGKLREILIARWCVARATRALGNPADALTMQLAIRAAWLDAHEEPDGYGSEEIAECLLDLGRPGEAQPYCAEAYARFKANATLADQPDRLERLRELGQVMD